VKHEKGGLSVVRCPFAIAAPYLEFGHEIGYTGGTGTSTRRVRVEWSEGVVHSHPRAK